MGASLAFDLGPVSIGPTPLAILISVVLVALVLLLVFLVASQIGGKLVDRRWPANQPLTPSEVLWGESGGYVKKTFPGLDPVIARDLSQYISTRKVPAGTTLVEAGDLPTQFMLLKSGAAEEDGGRGLKAGDSLGGENIISRTPHRATVRTTAASEVVSLGAEDYLAALALGMSADDDDYVVNVLGSYFDGDEATTARAGGGTATMAPPAPMPPPVAAPAPGWAGATHRVVTSDLAAFALPAGTQVTRVLAGGTPVQLLESLPGWVHVRTADGWQGWVADHGLGAAVSEQGDPTANELAPEQVLPPKVDGPAPNELRVIVLSAISRESSSCHVLAKLIADMAANEHGVVVDFVHPSDVGVPVNDGNVADDHPAAAAWQQHVAAAHCHIWVSPEYHSGMTGAMKNLFDFLGKEPMSGDVIGLVALAGGGMAALNTLNNMSVVARSLGAWVAPEHSALNSNDVKSGLGDGDLRRLQAMVTSVVGMARRVYG